MIGCPGGPPGLSALPSHLGIPAICRVLRARLADQDCRRRRRGGGPKHSWRAAHGRCGRLQGLRRRPGARGVL